MAILSRGPLGQISGKLAGMEFANHGGVCTVKRCKGHQSRWSPARARAQASQAAAWAYWLALDPEYRLQWSMLASQKLKKDRFGTSRQLTGFQLYLTLPHDSTYVGIPFFTSEVPFRGLYVCTINSVTLGPGSVLSVDANLVGFDEYAFCTAWVSRFCSSNSNARPSTWKWAGTVFKIHDAIDFSDALVGEGIAFVPGERVALKLQFWSVGYWPYDIDYGFVVGGS